MNVGMFQKITEGVESSGTGSNDGDSQRVTLTTDI
jgi:hypothetical protein